jgi:predicted RNA-binding protein with PIN domain/regulator of replication initiation timing
VSEAGSEVGEAEPVGAAADPAPSPRLPEPVRTRVIAMASDTLGRTEQQDLPASVRPLALFTPARRARLAGAQIAAALERDDGFRAVVAADVHARHPDLVAALATGTAPPAADPVEVAALCYLTRPHGWVDLVSEAVDRLEEERAGAESRQVSDQARQLRQQLDSLAGDLKEARRRHREQLAELKLENRGLRHRLADARQRARAAEDVSARAVAEAEEAVRAASASAAGLEAEIRRLRSRAADLERDLAAARRLERGERGEDTLRARLLVDTLLESARGLQRELSLPPVEGSPADAVAAHVAEEGSRASSGQRSLAHDDPLLLDELLGLPRAHLVVDGYNVTKTAWPELSLERQRDRLLAAVAPLAARTGAEVSVVFDAAETPDRPVVNRPRGVRVLFSPLGVIADDVIRELVAAEPRGRPVVVVSSDQAVARDVRRAGAHVVAASALSRLLART